MRSFQKQTYCYVSSEFKWMEKLDFPIRYGRSIAGTDFPVSDILHVFKKLRNNNKYLSTRVLLFAYPRDISVANRLKFSARWECVVELWHSDEKSRNAISKSSVGERSHMTSAAEGGGGFKMLTVGGRGSKPC